tara:strand:- start:319 stop:438 length:120 start_codon:yes stop_codon:yes gene_type:complete
MSKLSKEEQLKRTDRKLPVNRDLKVKSSERKSNIFGGKK